MESVIPDKPRLRRLRRLSPPIFITPEDCGLNWQDLIRHPNAPPPSKMQQRIDRVKRFVRLYIINPLRKHRNRLWQMTLGPHIYVKCSRSGLLRQSETAALRLVRKHTTVPVPRVWLSFSRFGGHYIFMTRVPGDTLEHAWKGYSQDMRVRILKQLAEYVSQIRTLQTPYGARVCSTIGGACGDARLLPPNKGPFENEDAMNTSLRCGLPMDDQTSPAVRAAHSIRHPIVFTHGDIAMRNIMVERETGRITALIDWEHAGWFPAHWEYCKAHFAELDESWVTCIDQFLDPYKVEELANKELSIFWYPH